jgi:hypothetical protein
MPPSSKGGPVTKAGKNASSRNAISHGLTAKKWIDPAEQESYQRYLSALNEDFHPQTLMEKTLIEKLADIKTRLERFHRVEDSLFSSAQIRAASPDIVVDSFDLEGEGVIEDVRNHALRLERGDNGISAELFYEIVQHDVGDISGWGYIKDNMPLLSEHIIEECHKENLDIEKLMNRYKPTTNDTPPIIITYSSDKPPEPITEQALDESGLKVRCEYFILYIKELYKRTQRRLLVSTVIEHFDGRTQLLKDGALPDGQALDRLMRYRNTLERQFSKTLGELLHLIKMREG